MLLLLTSTTTAAPLSAIQMGSKHNIYLATCTQKSSVPECPIIILCPRQQRSRTYSAAIYYANGPIESTGSSSPTAIATVADPAQPWEGEQRTARIRSGGPGPGGAFSSNITDGADTLKHGEIAGQAKLDSEDFACFRDGQTSFSVRANEDRAETANCKADYWCASIQA